MNFDLLSELPAYLTIFLIFAAAMFWLLLSINGFLTVWNAVADRLNRRSGLSGLVRKLVMLGLAGYACFGTPAGALIGLGARVANGTRTNAQPFRSSWSKSSTASS